jgi:hypothetical protein
MEFVLVGREHPVGGTPKPSIMRWVDDTVFLLQAGWHAVVDWAGRLSTASKAGLAALVMLAIFAISILVGVLPSNLATHPSWPGHAAYIATGLAFVVSDVLWLRVLATVGNFGTISWHAALEPATGRAAAAADRGPLLPRAAAWLLTPRIRVAHPKRSPTSIRTGGCYGCR